MHMKNYDILDISKFILAIFIIAIHTSLLPSFLYPWLRLAIPLFFIISSYLLHLKIKDSNKIEKKSFIKKYIKRNLTLYLFWFIALLPITIYARREWFANGIPMGVWTVITQTIFSSTFVASWYISATIIGTLIVEFLSEKIKKNKLIPVFIVPYIICCLVSSYAFLFQGNDLILSISNMYSFFFTSPVFSFPVSLIYIYIGKIIAENSKPKSKKTCIIALTVSLALLFIEWKITSSISGVLSNDCLFMLLPCAYFIMELLIQTNISIKNAKILRKMSVIMYPLHASLALIVRAVVDHFIHTNESIEGIIVFLTTLTLCLITCQLIFRLENKKHFKWLRYSH